MNRTRLQGLTRTLAWLAGSLLGAWQLYLLGAGSQSLSMGVAWTATVLLLLGGLLAIQPASTAPNEQVAEPTTVPTAGSAEAPKLAQTASKTPLPRELVPSAALSTLGLWAVCFLAGRMARSDDGGAAFFTVLLSLTCLLTGSLWSLLNPLQHFRSPLVDRKGATGTHLVTEFLVHTGVSLYGLTGVFLCAWVLGAGRTHPPAGLAVLPLFALLLGTAPRSFVQALTALGERIAAAAGTFAQGAHPPKPDKLPKPTKPTKPTPPKGSTPASNKPEKAKKSKTKS